MDWFLIKQNEHLGPFSEASLKELFENGDFSEEDLIWRDGWADARSFSEVFLEQDEFEPLKTESIEKHNVDVEEQEVIKSDELPPDLPPDLPPSVVRPKQHTISKDSESNIPHAGEIPKNIVHTAQPIADELRTDPEELSISEFQLVSLVESDDQVENKNEDESDQAEVIDFNEFEFGYEKDQTKILSGIKIFFVAAIFVFITWAGYLYLTDKENIFERPATMSLLDYERLTEVAKADNSELKFAFALASDKKTLWASTNNPLEGEVFVNMVSKKGRILGRDVEVKAKGELKDKLITFKDFQFIKGNKFFDGYYDVEVFTVDDLNVPLFQSMFKPTDKQFRFINEFLITSMNKEDFENQLKLRSKKKLANADEFWAEVYQKYTTMISITKKIKQGFEQVYQGRPDQWQENIQKFRTRYAKEYGVFFTEFVKSNESSFEKLIDKEFEDRINIIANYQRLSKLAKNIGVETMSLLAKMEAIDPNEFEQEAWQEQIRTSLSPFDIIVAECERKLAVLNQN